MPPTRTIPPAKAVKTERTHEENQERAYIAASRRSDRSLEARVESARRASEIHKRRTGRSLRVTEQDVINEEMYEEEDDDLPMQYRRLTAHLQTNSADFNRRLAAYLTSSVAMRSAVDQMNGNPGAQQYPMNAPQYAQPRPNMFQSPLLPQQSPQMTQSPTMMNSYRHAPYPSPHHPGFRQAHGRAYSAATLPTKMHTPPTPVPASLDHRRMSTPGTIPPPLETAAIKADPEYLRQTQSAQTPHSMTNPYWQDTSPFTTSLPPESQQMLAGAPGLDPHDPFSASLMQGSEQYVNHPYYPWGQQESKFGPYHAMSATLAPSALSNQTDSLAVTPSSNTATSYESRASHSMEPYGANHMHLNIKEGNSPYSLPSGQVTPGESFWSSFVQDSSWNDDGGVTIS